MTIVRTITVNTIMYTTFSFVIYTETPDQTGEREDGRWDSSCLETLGNQGLIFLYISSGSGWVSHLSSARLSRVVLVSDTCLDTSFFIKKQHSF